MIDDRDQEAAETKTLWRMHCPECGHEGTTDRKWLAYELVAVANDVRHDGESVADVEQIEVEREEEPMADAYPVSA